MNAREDLYAALMRGGPHSPDRSEKASALLDAFRAEALAEVSTREPLSAEREAGSYLEAQRIKGLLYDRISDFQQSVQLSGLQHAQIRAHLAAHLTVAVLAEVERLRAELEAAQRDKEHVARAAALRVERLERERDEARARVAELEQHTTTADLTVYRASHDSIVMGLYTTRQAAYEHCEAHELRDDPISPMAWEVDEDGVAELVRWRIPDATKSTGYVVTPLTVASAYDEEADD